MNPQYEICINTYDIYIYTNHEILLFVYVYNKHNNIFIRKPILPIEVIARVRSTNYRGPTRTTFHLEH